MSTDEKYHQYQNVFGRYQNLKQQQFQPKPAPTTAPEAQNMGVSSYLPREETHLIDGLPKISRRKGQLLLRHLKQNKNRFQWMDSGELIINGHPIPGSNLTDLVHHVTRNRPTARAPPGAAEFKALLQSTNAPQEALMQRQQQPHAIRASVGPSTPFRTPSANIPIAAAAVGTSFPPERRHHLKEVVRKRKKTKPLRWSPY